MTPRFVYNHQGELGAIRLSTGPKARPVAHDFSRPCAAQAITGRPQASSR